MSDRSQFRSRRWFVRTGTLLSGALTLGLSGSGGAQETEEMSDLDAQEDPNWREAIMFGDEFYAASIFRVVSPALEDPPTIANSDVIEDWTVRIIEFFNTNEEVYFFVPQDADLNEGELYRLNNESEIVLNGDDRLLEVQYRPLDIEAFPFDLEEGEDFESADTGGGEGAVRPRNLFTNALFRVTSGPQGWVPDDVEQSGYFTDYNTVHAKYLGTNDEFLFFPQEDAEVEEGALYVMWDEFELFDPAGNLAAIEFNPVDEESLSIDDEFL
ncbi:hypothetical protein [Halomontanus rarus]|uniref:hypothetical protein n=1 Tax=Halomontanus rarus TaxID=3034020 RepID=UPI0023E76CEA|nr:hypothetical protein [Halovivax sp. TS33]